MRLFGARIFESMRASMHISITDYPIAACEQMSDARSSTGQADGGGDFLASFRERASRVRIAGVLLGVAPVPAEWSCGR
jgi:hypothetical protein